MLLELHHMDARMTTRRIGDGAGHHICLDAACASHACVNGGQPAMPLSLTALMDMTLDGIHMSDHDLPSQSG